MQTAIFIKARSAATLIAASVFASLLLQIIINLEPGQSPIETFGLMMRYFTIWTNFACGLVLGWVSWSGKAYPRILFALTTAIVIVAVVYHALLAGGHHPEGLDWWTNLMFHTVIPAAVILWWLVFSKTADIAWKSLVLVIIYPIGYTMFALIHGAITGFYAYFFLDLPTLGWPQLMINQVGLAMLFVISGAALLGLRRIASRSTKA